MLRDNPIHTQIRDNLETVRENIYKAALRSGRAPDDVKLLVVTKTHSLDVIQCVIEAGATHLGENYVNEAVNKVNTLRETYHCHWHMIGHVQSSKSNLVVEYFESLHSLDSVKLARRLNSHAFEMKICFPVLLEFNLSGEDSKHGWMASDEQRWAALVPDIETIINLSNLQVCGLMTMPPFFGNPEDARPYFRCLSRLRDYLVKQFGIIYWKELSMGMSGDYEVAIEEGATWVRIGQAILGPRLR